MSNENIEVINKFFMWFLLVLILVLLISIPFLQYNKNQIQNKNQVDIYHKDNHIKSFY